MSERYLPTSNPAVAKLVAKARKTNDERDAYDRKAGHATPASMGMSELLMTAISAMTSGLDECLIAGVESKHLSCIAEGLCMVQDAELAIRGSTNE